MAQFSTDLEEIDISKYDCVLRNLEDLTEPTSDDFAVDVSSRDWIAYVKDPDGLANDPHNSEIVFMDLADHVVHRLTPTNGQYAGWNVDPHWKDDSTITWIQAQRMVEVSLDNLDRTDLGALNGTGDEPVFIRLGLSTARNEDDLEWAALEYSFRFDQQGPGGPPSRGLSF